MFGGLIDARTRLGRPEFDIRVQVMADHTDKEFLALPAEHVVLSSMNLHNWAYAETPEAQVARYVLSMRQDSRADHANLVGWRRGPLLPGFRR